MGVENIVQELLGLSLNFGIVEQDTERHHAVLYEIAMSVGSLGIHYNSLIYVQTSRIQLIHASSDPTDSTLFLALTFL